MLEREYQYMGQTGRTLGERFGEHRRDIYNNQHEKFGVAEHFNRPKGIVIFYLRGVVVKRGKGFVENT